eukprot:1600572-Rhodomonas_salina.1
MTGPRLAAWSNPWHRKWRVMLEMFVHGHCHCGGQGFSLGLRLAKPHSDAPYHPALARRRLVITCKRIPRGQLGSYPDRPA